MLVDSEDEDEGKGEEETTSSSTKHEAMALVNGNSSRAASPGCLTEGEPWCLPDPEIWGKAKPWAFQEPVPGGRNPRCLALAELLLCACAGDDGEQHGGVSPRERRGEELRGT